MLVVAFVGGIQLEARAGTITAWDGVGDGQIIVVALSSKIAKNSHSAYPLGICPKKWRFHVVDVREPIKGHLLVSRFESFPICSAILASPANFTLKFVSEVASVTSASSPGVVKLSLSHDFF